MFDSDIVPRSLVMEMKVGDAGPSRLGYYNTKQLLKQIRKRTRAMAYTLAVLEILRDLFVLAYIACPRYPYI